MTILEKIRNLPESRRRVIFWSTIIFIGLVLSLFYLRNIQNNIRNFKSIDLKEKLKTPDFGEELKGWPKLEIPEENLEELRKIEEEIEKLELENQTTTNEEKQATTTE